MPAIWPSVVVKQLTVSIFMLLARLNNCANRRFSQQSVCEHSQSNDDSHSLESLVRRAIFSIVILYMRRQMYRNCVSPNRQSLNGHAVKQMPDISIFAD